MWVGWLGRMGIGLAWLNESARVAACTSSPAAPWVVVDQLLLLLLAPSHWQMGPGHWPAVDLVRLELDPVLSSQSVCVRMLDGVCALVARRVLGEKP
jgi:hypothetical protein